MYFVLLGTNGNNHIHENRQRIREIVQSSPMRGQRPSATIDDIVARAMPVLANELAFSVLSGNLRAARVALASVTGADAEQARQVLNAAENRLNAEYTQRSTQLGPFYAQIDKLRLISQYEAVPTLSLSNYGRQ